MCGIYGIFSQYKTVLNLKELKKLQDRGQDSWGVGYFNDDWVVEKGFGRVPDKHINAQFMIGHVRYCTSGSADNEKEIQPLYGNNFLLAHNGNIPGCPEHDSTFLVNYLNRFDFIEDGLVEMVRNITGVYSLVVLTEDAIYAVRDCKGVRPLCLIIGDGVYTVASESDSPTFDIKPGEIIKINEDGPKVLYRRIEKTSLCIFEHIYFLNPKSVVDDYVVGDMRQRMGRILASYDTFPVQNYVVVGVPASGVDPGMGYSKRSGIEYSQLIKKSNQVRSFIQPTTSSRTKTCAEKYEFMDIENKNIILVDDSLVRGITMKNLVHVLKEKGAREIHVRINSPPVKSPCFFGIDMAKKELVAQTSSVEEICSMIGADSLVFLKENDMAQLFSKHLFCRACFTGMYDSQLFSW